MRNITSIVHHCTATKEGVDIGFKEIDEWHRKKGWGVVYNGNKIHCGYHFIVRIDGSVEIGRPIELPGAHVKGHNKNSVGVTYVGGLDKNMNPKDTRTLKQKEALKCINENLIDILGSLDISGHRDHSEDLNKNGVIEPFEWSKLCPCYDARKEYEYLMFK